MPGIGEHARQPEHAAQISPPAASGLSIIRTRDPEVGQLAAAYGHPDALLREGWKPPIPGIRAYGQYGDAPDLGGFSSGH